MAGFQPSILMVLLAFKCFRGEEVCYKDGTCEESSPTVSRYLLYDVNPGEGFNLRRDVYMRVAAAVRKLTEHTRWTLVLPPWGPLYHWQETRGEYETGIPWGRFFDVDSLAEYVPVVEFHQYVKEHGGRVSGVLQLQHYAEGWRDGHFEEKWHARPCVHKARFRRSDEQRGGSGQHASDVQYRARLWADAPLTASNFSCISIQGTSQTLAQLLDSQPYRSVLVDRAETILHDHYGGGDFWAVRRSMRFARHLVAAAGELRRLRLGSDDVADGTTPAAADCRPAQAAADGVRGGPYLAVHLRRRDFVTGRRRTVPSLQTAAAAIGAELDRLHLTTVYLATDAPATEVRQLEKLLQPKKMVRQQPSTALLAGEEAIIDQIVCSHARHFVGSYESTFSFRIQEERELMGFAADSTFNRLCGEAERAGCEQPTRWRLVCGS